MEVDQGNSGKRLSNILLNENASPAKALLDLYLNDAQKYLNVENPEEAVTSDGKESDSGFSNILKKPKRFDVSSPSAILRERYPFKKFNYEEESEEEEVPPRLPDHEILKGIHMFADVRDKEDNRSAGIKLILKRLGATVHDKLEKPVTHVIFREGLLSTYKKAKKLGCHLLSMFWLEAVRTSGRIVKESAYPSLDLELYESPLASKKIRRYKSMQPDYENKLMEIHRKKIDRLYRKQASSGTDSDVSPMKRRRLSDVRPLKEQTSINRRKTMGMSTLHEATSSDTSEKSAILHVSRKTQKISDFFQTTPKRNVVVQNTPTSFRELISPSQDPHPKCNTLKTPKRNIVVNHTPTPSKIIDMIAGSQFTPKKSPRSKLLIQNTLKNRNIVVNTTPEKTLDLISDSQNQSGIENACMKKPFSPEKSLGVDLKQVIDALAGDKNGSLRALLLKGLGITQNQDNESSDGDVSSLSDYSVKEKRVKLTQARLQKHNESYVEDYVNSQNILKKRQITDQKKNEYPICKSPKFTAPDRIETQELCPETDEFLSNRVEVVPTVVIPESEAIFEENNPCVTSRNGIHAPNDPRITEHAGSIELCPETEEFLTNRVAVVPTVVIPESELLFEENNPYVTSRKRIHAPKNHPIPDHIRNQELCPETEEFLTNRVEVLPNVVIPETEALVEEIDNNPYVTIRNQIHTPKQPRITDNARKQDSVEKPSDVTYFSPEKNKIMTNTNIIAKKLRTQDVSHESELLKNPIVTKSLAVSPKEIEQSKENIEVNETPKLVKPKPYDFSTPKDDETCSVNSETPATRRSRITTFSRYSIQNISKIANVTAHYTKFYESPERATKTPQKNSTLLNANETPKSIQRENKLTSKIKNPKSISEKSNDAIDKVSHISDPLENGIKTSKNDPEIDRLKRSEKESTIKTNKNLTKTPKDNRKIRTLNDKGHIFEPLERLRKTPTKNLEIPENYKKETSIEMCKNVTQTPIVNQKIATENSLKSSNLTRVTNNQNQSKTTPYVNNITEIIKTPKNKTNNEFSTNCINKNSKSILKEAAIVDNLPEKIIKTTENNTKVQKSIRKVVLNDSPTKIIVPEQYQELETPSIRRSSRRTTQYLKKDQVQFQFHKLESINESGKSKAYSSASSVNGGSPNKPPIRKSRKTKLFNLADLNVESDISLPDVTEPIQNPYLPKPKPKSPSPKKINIPASSRRSTHLFEVKKVPKQKRASTKASTIVCTRLHHDEIMMFEQIVMKLGGFEVEPNVSSRTTHLVAGEPQRTLNMLNGIVRGCWIVKYDWVLKSLEAGKWLDEESFELTEFSPAVQKCRIDRQTFGEPFQFDLFNDCGNIYIAKNTLPKQKDLQSLVKNAGGKVVTSPRQARIIVGQIYRNGLRIEEDVVCVNEKWVLESITLKKIKSFRKFILTNS